MIIISRSSSKLDHVGSKTRSLGKILEKTCVHSKRHSLDPEFIKLCQIVTHYNILVIISWSVLKLGHVGSKTRSIGQILEKTCVHSRRHSFDSKFMKLCQNDNHHNI